MRTPTAITSPCPLAPPVRSHQRLKIQWPLRRRPVARGIAIASRIRTRRDPLSPRRNGCGGCPRPGRDELRRLLCFAGQRQRMGGCTPRRPNSSTRPIRVPRNNRSSSSASTALVGRGSECASPIPAPRQACVSNRRVSRADPRRATTMSPSGGVRYRYRAYGHAAGSRTPMGSSACVAPGYGSVRPHASDVSRPSSLSSVRAAAADDPGPRAVTRSPSTVTLVSSSRSASHSAPAAFTSSSTQ